MVVNASYLEVYADIVLKCVNRIAMSDWEEVRKLAADFQQLQATAGANKLSERNCIELVTRLIQMGQIDVVYTVDGKEYVTPQHLEKEIKNELLVHRGRQISL